MRQDGSFDTSPAAYLYNAVYRRCYTKLPTMLMLSCVDFKDQSLNRAPFMMQPPMQCLFNDYDG